MKSARAGMYPAISRDSTESNVGRGGSSLAVILDKNRIHTHQVYSILTILFITHATCTALPTFVYPTLLRVLKYFTNASFSAVLLEFPQLLRDVTVKYLSNTVADGDLKADWNQGKFLTDQMFTSVLFH